MTTELMQSIERERAARQQAWEDFVAVLRNGRTSVLLRHAADLIEDRRDPFYRTPIKDEIDTFAQTHGWPATLRAISQAMQDDERHRRELVDRR
jgi:hypothetical protein